jgi:hypothetical protein
MSVEAKEILKNKFWIVESKGERLGTLSVNDEKQYMLTNQDGTRFFSNIKQLKSSLNTEISWTDSKTIEDKAENIVHGYATSCTPYNPIFDVKNKLPLFTKSQKSKSLYCAGYFIIKFDKGWVKSFCPKMITVERYITQGPFKTDIEMRQALSIVNAR